MYSHLIYYTFRLHLLCFVYHKNTRWHNNRINHVVITYKHANDQSSKRICRQVVSSYHNWSHFGMCANLIITIVSPMTSIITWHSRTKLTEGNSFGFSQSNVSQNVWMVCGMALGGVPVTRSLHVSWTTHGGHQRLPPFFWAVSSSSHSLCIFIERLGSALISLKSSSKWVYISCCFLACLSCAQPSCFLPHEVYRAPGATSEYESEHLLLHQSISVRLLSCLPRQQSSPRQAQISNHWALVFHSHDLLHFNSSSNITLQRFDFSL